MITVKTVRKETKRIEKIPAYPVFAKYCPGGKQNCIGLFTDKCSGAIVFSTIPGINTGGWITHKDYFPVTDPTWWKIFDKDTEIIFKNT